LNVRRLWLVGRQGQLILAPFGVTGVKSPMPPLLPPDGYHLVKSDVIPGKVRITVSLCQQDR
jgi:hypothetical protein